VGEVGIERAVEVQTALARKGQHRGLAIPDLLIAAAAEAAGLTVLHYDADFDRVAEVTGQPTEWVVPKGSVP
jgi:predicted nucleic acid-binding protein